jgi:hypothetical protein
LLLLPLPPRRRRRDEDDDVEHDGGGDGRRDGRIGRASAGVVPATATAVDFGMALRSLDERGCYRFRLQKRARRIGRIVIVGKYDDDDE